ncbi:MAG: glycosyltransferase [Bacteroidota bacterium]
MNNIINVILIVTLVIYVIQIVRWTIGLFRLHDSVNLNEYSVDVLIAARNEEEGISKCIESLLNQDYPSTKYRITIIDDNSNDNTAHIVENYCLRYPDRITLLKVTDEPHNISPKINALSYATSKTSNEIILTTDADCFVTENWISTIVSTMSDSIGAVTGLTKYRNNANIPQMLFGIQYLDYISLNSVSAGSIGIGSPNTANGCNMAFRRKAFEDVKGFSAFRTINSGYDSFLVQKIVATEKWEAKYISDPTSFVTTNPVNTWMKFLNQRMRWSAQTTKYRWTMQIFMISTFILYCFLAITLPLTLFVNNILPLYVFAIKAAIDFIILYIFTTKYKINNLLRYYIPAMVIHIPFTIAAVFGGYFTRYDWKERKLGRQL